LFTDSDDVQLENAKLIMTIATFLWFVTAPIWMLRATKAEDDSGAPVIPAKDEQTDMSAS
jgi:hypothetical protein